MILVSHQPNFLPYLGFFYKVSKCDIFVISDDVQFSKKAMHNWNRIKEQNGVSKITVPVHAHHTDSLNDVKLVDGEYNSHNIAKRISQAYHNSEHFLDGMEVVDLLEKCGKSTDSMVEFNIMLLLKIVERFGINPKILYGSEDLNLNGHKDERIFQMCEKTGADTYLSGTGASVYHKPDDYKKRNINLVYSDFEPIEYKQLYVKFVPNLSVIDYIFNCGWRLPDEWRKD